MMDTPLRVDIHNELMAFFTPGKHDFEDATENIMKMIDQEATKRTVAALESTRDVLRMISDENKARGSAADVKPDGYHCGQCDSWGVCHACSTDLYIGAELEKIDAAIKQAKGESRE